MSIASVSSRETADGEIQVASAAINAGGRIFNGQHHRVKLALKPDTLAAARQHGVRILSELTLPPGRYQLRVAASGTGDARAGSVMYDLDVPDFTNGALVMSGVSLTSESAGHAVTSAPVAPMRDLLPSPPTAAREFDRGDALTIYAEVYQNIRERSSHTVTLTAALRDNAGRVLQAVKEERHSTELAGQTGGYGFRAVLPLADAAPGNLCRPRRGARQRQESANRQPRPPDPRQVDGLVLRLEPQQQTVRCVTLLANGSYNYHPYYTRAGGVAGTGVG